MKYEIVQREAAVLRKTTEPVERSLFGSARLEKLLLAMSAALATCEDGVALAAPQIGVSEAIFIVAGKVFRENESDPLPPDVAFINPRLTKLSAKKRLLDEGCLSVRGWYGKIERAEKATVEAYDFEGKKFSRGASGLLAQIFQHEMDHLQGVLFIDKAVSLEETAKRNQA